MFIEVGEFGEYYKKFLVELRHEEDNELWMKISKETSEDGDPEFHITFELYDENCSVKSIGFPEDLRITKRNTRNQSIETGNAYVLEPYYEYVFHYMEKKVLQLRPTVSFVAYPSTSLEYDLE